MVICLEVSLSKNNDLILYLVLNSSMLAEISRNLNSLVISKKDKSVTIALTKIKNTNTNITTYKQTKKCCALLLHLLNNPL